jgi:hypothetical protein
VHGGCAVAQGVACGHSARRIHVFTRRTAHKYPMLPTKLEMAIVIPRLCMRSEYHAAAVSTTAATAYGGTVRSCAVAFSAHVPSVSTLRAVARRHPRKPRVLMIVGRKAEMDASAQLSPK